MFAKLKCAARYLQPSLLAILILILMFLILASIGMGITGMLRLIFF